MKILLSIIFITACGGLKPSKSTHTPLPQPDDRKEVPPPPPPTADIDILTVENILAADCALSGCHAGAAFLNSKEAFLNSTSIPRIKSGSMPPPGSPRYSQWTDEKKQFILDAFEE